MEKEERPEEGQETPVICKNKCKDSKMSKHGWNRRKGQEPRQQWKCSRCKKVTIEGAKKRPGPAPEGTYKRSDKSRQKKRYYSLTPEQRKAANLKRSQYRRARKAREKAAREAREEGS